MAVLKLVLYLSLMLISCSASSDNIYKWVGKDGVVHYGSKPPASTVDTDTEVIALSRGGSQNFDVSRRSINATWWGVLGSSLVSLRLHRESFRINRYYTSKRLDNFRRIAEGHLELTDDKLYLTYFTHHEDQSKVDEVDQFTVHHPQPTELHLTGETGKRLIFHRIQDATPDDMSRTLKGSWTVEGQPKTRYDFDHGSLKIQRRFGPYNWRTASLANWHWEDPEVVMHFIANLDSPAAEQAGEITRWNIHRLTAHQAIVVDTGSRRTLVLVKEK